MSRQRPIGIGLLGLGVVGTGVAESLLEKPATIARRAGASLELRGALVRNLEKLRPLSAPPFPLTTNPEDILDSPDVDIIVEVMGGEQPARDYIERALQAGKHVVTANKEVMAKQGHALLALASERGLHLRFEASVGAGIPLIGPLQRDLLANEITSVRAIINGTTNYILTKMANEGMDFAAALAQAQQLGYSEPDPTNDVEGIDAAYKLAILATLAFHASITAADVPRAGVTHLRAKDFQYARELGYAIKLLAIGTRDDQGISVRVHPAFVPEETLLAKVDGAFNAVEVKGNLTGTVTFHGLGAGAKPTASALLGDVVNIARAVCSGATTPLQQPPSDDALHRICGMGELVTRYYLRLSVADQAGVLAQIASALGREEISLASVIQKGADEAAGTAEIVITTHPAQEARLQRAMEAIRRLEVVREVENVVRVESV